jgi:PAS domain S-box-containing protein
VGVAYYVAATLSLRLALVEENVTPVWPPTGIALVALLAYGMRIWPGIAVAAFLVNLPISPSPAAAAAIAVGNTLAPLVAASLLRRARFRPELDRARDAVALVFLGALLSMLISATLGTGALVASGAVPAGAFLPTWFVWWAGDATGILVFAPFLMSLRWARPIAAASWRLRWEAMIVFVGLAVVSAYTAFSPLQLHYLVFPLLIWAAWRFGQRGAAAAAVLVSGFAVWAAVQGAGPFSEGTLVERMVALQVFNGAVALTSFVLAAIVTEREDARQAIVSATQELGGGPGHETKDLEGLETELRRKAGSLRLLEAISTAANEAGSMDRAMQAAVDLVCAYTRWPVGHVYVLDRSGDMAPTSIWHIEEPERFEEFRRITEATRFAPGRGLPGQVLMERKPSLIPDVQRASDIARAPVAEAVGVRGGFAFPVMVKAEAVAVLEFFSPEVAALDPSLLEIMAHVGTQLGRVVERQQAEDAVRASDQLSRSIIETANDAFVAIDQGGLITDWNHQAELTFGWSKEEVIGRPLADTIIPTQYRGAHLDGLKHFLATGEGPVIGQRLELSALHRRGDEFPVELLVWPIQSSAGYQFNAFIRDITERRQAEEALRESETRLRAILTSIADGVVATDPDGRIVSINPAMERLGGWSHLEVRGHPQAEVFPLLDANGRPISTEKRFLLEAIRSRAVVASHGFDVTLLARDGRRVPVSVTAAPILDSTGALLGGVKVVRDVSHEREVDQIKSSLVSTVSHELRTPLTMIRGFAELLLARDLPQEKGREALEQINTAAERLSRLIDDLLSVARIDSGSHAVRVEPIEVVEVVHDALAGVPFAQQVELDIDPGIPPVVADRDMCVQILTNLVSNAVKYSPQMAPVSLRARCEDDTVEVSVQDRGIGMTGQEMEQLFQKFYRVDRPEVRAVGGTGLGLYITKNLVELQGGRIWVESDPQHGSSFTFSLPAAAETAYREVS